MAGTPNLTVRADVADLDAELGRARRHINRSADLAVGPGWCRFPRLSLTCLARRGFATDAPIVTPHAPALVRLPVDSPAELVARLAGVHNPKTIVFSADRIGVGELEACLDMVETDGAVHAIEIAGSNTTPVQMFERAIRAARNLAPSRRVVLSPADGVDEPSMARAAAVLAFLGRTAELQVDGLALRWFPKGEPKRRDLWQAIEYARVVLREHGHRARFLVKLGVARGRALPWRERARVWFTQRRDVIAVDEELRRRYLMQAVLIAGECHVDEVAIHAMITGAGDLNPWSLQAGFIPRPSPTWSLLATAALAERAGSTKVASRLIEGFLRGRPTFDLMADTRSE